jgi:hypothetical protein
MYRGVIWYEIRELGAIAMLMPLLVVAGVALSAGIMMLGGAQTDVIAEMLTRSMETLFPLAIGTVAASVVASDIGIEWQLTMPTAYRTTLVRRLAILVTWSAVVAFGDAIVLRMIDRWLAPEGFVVAQLMWLSPMLALVALGAVLALLVRNRSAAAGLVGGLWVLELVLPSTFVSHAWARPWFLFATSFAAGADFWLANRLALIGTAVALFGGVAALLGQNERLLIGGEA